jgi:hypothetical protein
VTSATFAKWVLSGILPSTVSIAGKYDMRALDAALDKLSGIKSIEQSEDSFESWKRGRDATCHRSAFLPVVASIRRPGWKQHS